MHCRAMAATRGALRGNSLAVPPGPGFELVLSDLAAKRVAMNAEHACGAGLIAFGTVQHALDELLFKFRDRLVEHDSAFHHLSDQRFELVFHNGTLRREVRGCSDGSRQDNSWPVSFR